MRDYSGMKPAKLQNFESIIRGLLTKRVTLYHEREEQLSNIASLDNDISAIDRAIRLLGYEGDLNALMPKNAGNRRYKQGDVSRHVSDVLRTATEPLTSRQIANKVAAVRGENTDDHRHMVKLTNNVSRVLGGMRKQGRVVSEGIENGVQLWRLAST
ncbi:hypothetical protein AB1K42_12915 [Roseibium algicola]|uniref:hypothetical protein n=1 Tax=Roseibium algicola TaxID=2857014 RepID=UPI0034577BFD